MVVFLPETSKMGMKKDGRNLTEGFIDRSGKKNSVEEDSMCLWYVNFMCRLDRAMIYPDRWQNMIFWCVYEEVSGGH